MQLRMKGISVLLTAVVAAIVGWWWFTRPPKLNLVLITLDTTRADRLGCYGHSSAHTPNLDRLADRGVLFAKAYTAVPITLPSHATMLTGLLPPEHGVRINGTSRLAEGVPTLAEILEQRGYRTGAFVSSLVLDGRFGLSRGFSNYDDRLPRGPGTQEAERSAMETISAALAWLRSSSSTPFFCWVHLYDPHEPYRDHPEEFNGRFQGNPYDAEVAYMDLHLGRLLDFISQQGLDARTLIVIAGDHGEGLNEHREPTHGFMAYNSTMHVPLIMAPPRGGKTKQQVAEPVSLVDVFPTILDVLGVSAPNATTGRTLQPAFDGRPLPERPCYGETEAPYLEAGWCPLRTWTTSRWKFIQTTRAELYDLAADPGELRNLLTDQPDEAAELEQALSEFESRLQLRQGTATVLSPAERQALAGLGYTGGQEPARKQEGERRDIKDTIQYVEEAHRCSHLVHQGQADRAQAILEEVVQALPDYAKGWGMLGICCLVQNNFAGAEQNYRRALQLDANQNFSRIGLGRALLSQNRPEEAIAELQAGVKFDPVAADGQYFLGEACLRMQRWEEANAAFEAVLKLVPDLTAARVGLGDVARDSGNAKKARELYESALERDPGSTTAKLRLGQILAKSGQDSEALFHFEELLMRNDRQPEALAETARLLATAQDPAVRNPVRAVVLAEQACRLTDRREIAPLRVLAMAYAARRRPAQAVQTAEQALDLARKSGSAEQIAEIQKELEGYSAQAVDTEPVKAPCTMRQGVPRSAPLTEDSINA